MNEYHKTHNGWLLGMVVRNGGTDLSHHKFDRNLLVNCYCCLYNIILLHLFSHKCSLQKEYMNNK